MSLERFPKDAARLSGGKRDQGKESAAAPASNETGTALASALLRGGAEPAPAPPVPTPCIGVCWLDETSGLCTGCARTGDEVAAWQAADDDYKRRVWDALPERRERMGLATYRLPWSVEEIAGFVARSLRQRGGRWVLGLDGASVSFAIAEGEDAEIVSGPDGVTVITESGALRLAIHPKTIAVAFGAPLRRPGLEPGPIALSAGASGRLERDWAPAQGRSDEKETSGAAGSHAIGLVLPRGRVDVRRGDKLAKIGPDVAALAASTDAQLYDLGIAASAASRICLRTADPALIAALDRLEGRNWREALAEAGPLLAAAPPDYVIETGLGRAEYFATPLPPKDLRDIGRDARIRSPLAWGEGQGEGLSGREEYFASDGASPPSLPPSPEGGHLSFTAKARDEGVFAAKDHDGGPFAVKARDGGLFAIKDHEGRAGSPSMLNGPESNEAAAIVAELRRDASPPTELPHGWSLPAVFAPCAFFYPYRRRPADALLGGDF